MIIQCEQCETTYQFDSAQLQNGEAQVRCIRCGNVFRIDAQSDIGESRAEESLAQPADLSTPEAQSLSRTPDTSVPLAESTFTEFSADTSAQESTFAIDTPVEETQEEDDFWTSTKEFSLDPSAEAEPPKEQDSALAGSAQTLDSDSNEFIFDPLDDTLRDETPEPPAMPDATEDTPVDSVVLAPQPDPVDTAPEARATKSKKKGSKLLLALLLILLIGAGVFAYYFVTYGVTSAPQLISKVEQQVNQWLNPQPKPAGPSISIQSGDNFYINNDHLGSLFVVTGKVTNISAQPQGEIAVIATLHASDGTVLRSIKVFCGNPISRDELRSATLEQLQGSMSNKLGAGLSNVSVQPGESIPFYAVFSDLPENFAEFGISEAATTSVNK